MAVVPPQSTVQELPPTPLGLEPQRREWTEREQNSRHPQQECLEEGLERPDVNRTPFGAVSGAMLGSPGINTLAIYAIAAINQNTPIVTTATRQSGASDFEDRCACPATQGKPSTRPPADAP